MPSDRLLQNMHKVFSHDLPNQMVALASLLQLLRAEEYERLTGDGREYVRRLQNATHKAAEMVRFLKEMGRLNGAQAKAEPIVLNALGRELQGELQQLYPQMQFAFEWQWSAPSIHGDLKSFVGAILEICACFLNGRLGRCTISATSRNLVGATELAFFLEDHSTTPPEGLTPTPLRWHPQTLNQRMEIILAREWLALSEGSVEFTVPGSGGVRFVIVVPS